jgi:hypothetical protein
LVHYQKQNKKSQQLFLREIRGSLTKFVAIAKSFIPLSTYASNQSHHITPQSILLCLRKYKLSLNLF